MSNEPPNENQRSDVRSLSYLAPIADDVARRARRNALVAGALFSGATVFGGVFVVIIAAVSDTNPVIVIGIAVAIVALVTLFQHFVRQRSGFVAGVLIGIGVAALIEGACFVTLIR